MKGFLPFTIAIIGIIFTFTSAIVMTIPLLVLKYHLLINLKQEYDYNNAQLALLSLVSSKYNDTTSIYRILSERNLNGFDENMKEKIEDNLKLLILSNCFRIVNDTGTVLDVPGCSPSKYAGEVYIFRPYNRYGLIEKLILVYE